MSRYFRRDGGYLVLTGDTFPVKDSIKTIGARWDGAGRTWKVRESPQTLAFLESLGFFPIVPVGGHERESPAALGSNSALAVASPTAPFASAFAVDGVSTPPALPVATAGEGEVVARETERVWRVGEFMRLVEEVIARHLGFDFWVVGEITSLRVSNGHSYFDLAERAEENEGRLGRAQSVSCVLWTGKRKLVERERGELPLSEGVAVKLRVHPEFRKDQGRLVLVVDDCDPAFTLGDLALQRQAIVRELKKRGLYDLNKRTTLPPFPHRVALVSADGSRALTDFLDEIRGSGLAFRATLFDCHMQGESTSKDVSSALQAISTRKDDFDVVVITRGGGSRLDLRWFDDFDIAKAIAHCPLPVVTAIGHFEDVSVADEVSHFAEKTPTGAASYLVDAMARTLQWCHDGLARAANAVSRRVRAMRELVHRGEASLVQAARRRMHVERGRLVGYDQTLRIVRAQSAKPLARGYALARALGTSRRDGKAGKVLLARDFLAGGITDFEIALHDVRTFTDITVRARVLEVERAAATDTTKGNP